MEQTYYLQGSIRTLQLKFASIMDEMVTSIYANQEKDVVGKFVPTCKKISIDML